MWLPTALKKIHQDKMEALDIQLTTEDIYDINNSSVKDAIIRLNGGQCTAEVVSEKGLLFTNHHCAYDLISNHSTEENNLLEEGFFAEELSEEIKNEDYTASRLVRMEKVTGAIAPALDTLEGRKATRKLNQLSDSLVSEATEGNEGYTAEVKAMYHDNEYYLTVYEQFKDIRLVGAPPKDIGKFGGDTDNWMWPRHTGDFSVLRIYAGEDNEPAPISDDNQPYDAPYNLSISLNGYEQGDAAMIMGYPGSTDRYLSSHAIEHKMKKEEPAIIDAFGAILDNMKAKMDESKKAELSLTSRYASLSNFYKYNKGQLKGLKDYDLVSEKEKTEEAFMAWVNEKEARQEKYGTVLENLGDAYDRLNGIAPGFYHFGYGLSQLDLFGFAYRYQRFRQNLQELKADGASEGKIDTAAMEFRQRAREFFDETFVGMERQAMKDILAKYVKQVPVDEQPDVLQKLINANPGQSAEKTVRQYLDNTYQLQPKDQLNLMGYAIRLNNLGRRLTTLDDQDKADSLLNKARERVMAYHKHKGMEAVGGRAQFKDRLLTIAQDMEEQNWPNFLVSWKAADPDKSMKAIIDNHVADIFSGGLFRRETLLASAKATRKAMDGADAATLREDPLIKLGGQLKGYDQFRKEAIALDSAKTMELLANPSVFRLSNEQFLDLAGSLFSFFRTQYLVPYRQTNQQINDYMQTYMQGIREWKAGKEKLYPNANSTMRVSYGVVEGYEPADAKDYAHYTTQKGIVQKRDPSDEEFQVPDVLMEHIRNENYGRYAAKDGNLRICFLTDNDITGGNSGSPVVNGKGNLIGIAFDGNYESMTGDLVIDESINRTINVDIRYVLFVIDKLYDSQHVMEELEIVEKSS